MLVRRRRKGEKACWSDGEEGEAGGEDGEGGRRGSDGEGERGGGVVHVREGEGAEVMRDHANVHVINCTLPVELGLKHTC